MDSPRFSSARQRTSRSSSRSLRRSSGTRRTERSIGSPGRRRVRWQVCRCHTTASRIGDAVHHGRVRRGVADGARRDLRRRKAGASSASDAAGEPGRMDSRSARAVAGERPVQYRGDLSQLQRPTLALSFLDSRYRRRFRFTDGGPGEIHGSPLRRIRFAEVVTPTVIRNENRNLRASGTLIVEPATGRVLRTELTLLLDKSNAKNSVRAELTVAYRPDARLGLLVPVQMHESYGFAGAPDQRIECPAGT